MLSKLKVRTRLLLGFGILVGLMLTLTILGIQKVNIIDKDLSVITDINSVKQRYAINFRGSVHDRAIALRDVVLARTPQEIRALEEEIITLAEFYREAENNFQKMLSSNVMFSTEEHRILKEINDIKNRTEPIIQKILADKANGISDTNIILDQARPAFIAWLDTINQFIDYQENLNQTLTPQTRSVAGGFQNLMLALSAIALVISAIIAIAIERSFHTSLGGEPYDAQSAIKRLSEGQLKNEFSKSIPNSIMDSLSEMSKKMTHTVGNIISVSHNLTEQANQVSQGSTRVLELTQQQAKLTQDTVGELEDMRQSIDQISELASQTENNSVMTSDNSKKGRELVFSVAQEMENIAVTVNQTVEQVQQLEQRTNDIGGIVSVISGIAEQTNLLALNAAIEAARAGESGRGFAVVADEVRQLASRATESTTQIETMISEIQQQTTESVQAMANTQPLIEQGKEKTTLASTLLVNIEGEAKDTLGRVKDVVQATNEQASFVRKVASSIEQISVISDESVQSMTSNRDAALTMSEQANRLKQEVNYFSVD